MTLAVTHDARISIVGRRRHHRDAAWRQRDSAAVRESTRAERADIATQPRARDSTFTTTNVSLIQKTAQHCDTKSEQGFGCY